MVYGIVIGQRNGRELRGMSVGSTELGNSQEEEEDDETNGNQQAPGSDGGCLEATVGWDVKGGKPVESGQLSSMYLGVPSPP